MKQTQTTAPRKGHDPAKTAANRTRRIAAEQRKQAEARQRKTEQALTRARAVRRAQEQMQAINVHTYGKAAEIHHLIRRPAALD